MTGVGHRAATAALLASVSVAGCGGGAPVAPSPVPEPVVSAPVPDLWESHPPLALLSEGTAGAEPDEILRAPMVRHPEVQAAVQEWVAHWTETGRRWLPGYLERMGWFSPLVDSALAVRELPPSLRYLPIVESGYSPRAVSRVSAVGLWQLMAPTARGFGMEVTPLLDERRNPLKSTDAALDFLQDLRNRFDSWFLALAAYNAGPGRVRRILRRHAPLTPGSDSLYWALRPHLPRETRDFVPKFLAAVEVARNPRLYGVEVPVSEWTFDFDRVVVPDATTLDVVARAAESDEELIARLNPEVVRGITPPGEETLLRVPRGRGWLFRRNYPKIPPSERVTFVEHRVRSGETLTHIARRYRVSVSDLTAANPGVRPRYLQIGQRLTVPIAPSVRRGG